MYKLCESHENPGLKPTFIQNVDSIGAGIGAVELIAGYLRYDYLTFELDEENDAADVFIAKTGTYNTKIYTIEKVAENES